MPNRFGAGCRCCRTGTVANCGRICVTVNGCPGKVVSGAIVSVSLAGVLVGSATAAASGIACVPIHSAGTYAIAVTAPAGSNYGNGSGTLTIGACTTTDKAAAVTLSPLSGYSCSQSVCCNNSGPPYQVIAPWATLYLNDGFGTVTLSGNGTGLWTGSATRTANCVTDCTTSTTAPTAVTVYFQIGCGNGAWNANVGAYPCGDGQRPSVCFPSPPGTQFGVEYCPVTLTPGPTCYPAAVSASGTGDFYTDQFGSTTPIAGGLSAVYGRNAPDAGYSSTWTRITLALTS